VFETLERWPSHAGSTQCYAGAEILRISFSQIQSKLAYMTQLIECTRHCLFMLLIKFKRTRYSRILNWCLASIDVVDFLFESCYYIDEWNSGSALRVSCTSCALEANTKQWNYWNLMHRYSHMLFVWSLAVWNTFMLKIIQLCE